LSNALLGWNAIDGSSKVGTLATERPGQYTRKQFQLEGLFAGMWRCWIRLCVSVIVFVWVTVLHTDADMYSTEMQTCIRQPFAPLQGLSYCVLRFLHWHRRRRFGAHGARDGMHCVHEACNRMRHHESSPSLCCSGTCCIDMLVLQARPTQKNTSFLGNDVFVI